MAMNSKERYAAFLLELEEVPVFHEPWFLDAVCGAERWDLCLVEEGEAVQAVMPYYRPRPDQIGMPPLTQSLGPLLRPVRQKDVSRLSREKRLLTGLIAQLPAVKRFSQRFGPHLTNWLPFHWAGFQQTTRYTYRFDALSDLDAIWDGMSSKLRGHIRHSEEAGIRIEPSDDPGPFLDLVDRSYANHGRRNPNPRALVERLHRAAVEHEAGQLYVAIDPRERVHAAAFLIWNDWCAINLAGGGDPALRSSGAHNHLLWELIKAARACSRTFDFEGSMVESIERAFRSFGARQAPYFAISRDARSGLEQWIGSARSRIAKALNRTRAGRKSQSRDDAP